MEVGSAGGVEGMVTAGVEAEAAAHEAAAEVRDIRGRVDVNPGVFLDGPQESAALEKVPLVVPKVVLFRCRSPSPLRAESVSEFSDSFGKLASSFAKWSCVALIMGWPSPLRGRDA